MTISAKIIADSVSPDNIRLTTFQLRYPKFIHGELMTHRVFSRNASSSRAIPVERMIQDVIDDPAIPTYWGKNKPGMQATEELTEEEKAFEIREWLADRNYAVFRARERVKRNLHKQLANRPLEPFCHINTLVTSTSWANWYALRNHEMAQPEIHTLAACMLEEHKTHRPALLGIGDWHVPYVQYDPFEEYTQEQWIGMVHLSVARCARVSYLTQDGKEPNVLDDVALYERLIGNNPLHASPAEHQATPDVIGLEVFGGAEVWMNGKEHGNFTGWRQYRKMLPGEYVEDTPYV